MPAPRWTKVTKIDAAKRQVQQALQLWFDDGDAVSIHTLLYAAVEILDGLVKRKTGKRLFFGNEAMAAIPGMLQLIKSWPNFFKHGRLWELDKVLNFNPEANMVLICACVDGLDKLEGKRTHLASAFAYWCLVNDPDLIGGERADHMTTEELRHLRALSKREFLEQFLLAVDGF
jgi:hypothetical protein